MAAGPNAPTQIEAARADAQQALALDSGSLKACYRLGQALLLQQQVRRTGRMHGGAGRAADPRARQFSVALDTLSAGLERHPKQPVLTRARQQAKVGLLAAMAKTAGNTHFVEKQYADAVRRYTDGLDMVTAEPPASNGRQDPGQISLTNLAASLLCNRSVAYLKLGEVQKAVDDARISTELDPHFVKAWLRLGMALEQQGKVAEAMAAYEECLQKNQVSDELRTALDTARKKLAPVGKEPAPPAPAAGAASTPAGSGGSVVAAAPVPVPAPVAQAGPTGGVAAAAAAAAAPVLYGPVRLVNVGDRGRGYVATQDVVPGTLLLRCSAIAMAYDDLAGRDCVATHADLAVALLHELIKVCAVRPASPGLPRTGCGLRRSRTCGRKCSDCTRPSVSPPRCPPRLASTWRTWRSLRGRRSSATPRCCVHVTARLDSGRHDTRALPLAVAAAVLHRALQRVRSWRLRRCGRASHLAVWRAYRTHTRVPDPSHELLVDGMPRFVTVRGEFDPEDHSRPLEWERCGEGARRFTRPPCAAHARHQGSSLALLC